MAERAPGFVHLHNHSTFSLLDGMQKVDEMCAPHDQPEEIRKLYYQNPQLLSQVENLVMEDQVVDWLVSRATVSEKVTGFKELMNG